MEEQLDSTIAIQVRTLVAFFLVLPWLHRTGVDDTHLPRNELCSFDWFWFLVLSGIGGRLPDLDLRRIFKTEFALGGTMASLFIPLFLDFPELAQERDDGEWCERAILLVGFDA